MDNKIEKSKILNNILKEAQKISIIIVKKYNDMRLILSI
jgi:hypothetical protein